MKNIIVKYIAVFFIQCLMAAVSCSQGTPVQTGWKQICEYESHDSDMLFQGLLFRNGELYQCFDKGMVNVLDAGTFDFKRSFQLPYHGHYSTVEWLDDSHFATTDYACNLYITDISDESNIVCDSLHLSSLVPDFYTVMAALAYDRDNRILYVSGYSPCRTFRRDVVTSALDLSAYLDGKSEDISIIDTWTVPSYHIQDGCFYKGYIWHLSDKTIGQASKPYDCLSVYVLDPATKSIAAKFDIPRAEFTEAQGLTVFDDQVIISDVVTEALCRYYKIDMDFSDKDLSEEQRLSPQNPERNALCAGYALYDFETERKDKPAPDGYEPFYMVHYGRHGARYLGSDADYEFVHEVFAAVPDDGLTPIGRTLADRYNLVCPELIGRGGDLSDLGKRQLSLLGKRYIKAYPQIFHKGATVLAESSKVPRCIVSASYFCDALDDAGCKVDLNINSTLAESKIRRAWYPEDRDAYADSLLRARVDIEGICRRLFINGTDAVKGDAGKFVKTLWMVACDMPLTHRPDVTFTPAFSYEDLVALKSVEDDMYRRGRGAVNTVESEYSRVLLDHLFAVATEDIRSGNGISARLFFGHDTPLMSLMCLLDPEGWAENWSTSDIPVAANLRMVFYRKDNDILYKIQLNESDVTDYLQMQ